MRIAGALLLVSIASACNALTGADSLVAEDARPQEPDPTGSSSGTSGSRGGPSTEDGGSSGSSGSDGSASANDSGTVAPPDPGSAILDTRFDTAAECTAWTVVGDGTRSWSATLGRTAAGACVFCSAKAGTVDFERKGKAPRAGKLAASLYVRRMPDKTTPQSFYFAVQTSSGLISTSQGFNAFETWTPGGTGAQASIIDGEDVTIRIGLHDVPTPECIVVDDVLVNVK